MTRDRFRVGQRVIWKCRPGEEYTATVISQRERRQEYRKGELTGKFSLVYRLDVDGLGTRVKPGYLLAAPQPELRPMYDGDQPASWSRCAWRPREVCHG